MATINWTDESLYWLDEIYEFIAKDNPQAAFRTVDGIYERTQILQTFPEIGHIYENPDNRNIRILLYGHFRIAYLIRPDNVIDILGIFHGSLDIDRFLKES
jgi:plasmid stabilization system protein ParE